MSDLYKADASNFTREQLIELINHQTNLHLEAQVTMITAKVELLSLSEQLKKAEEVIAAYAGHSIWNEQGSGKKSEVDDTDTDEYVDRWGDQYWMGGKKARSYFKNKDKV